MSGELLFGPAREARRATWVWAVSLTLLVLLNTVFWPSVRDSPELDRLAEEFPPALAEAFGLSDLTSPEGFLESQLYALLVPLLLAVAGVVVANGLTARREDSGDLELIVAQPLARASILGARAVVAAGVLALLGVAMLLAQVAVDAAVDLRVGLGRLMATLALTVLLGWLHAGAAVALAGVTGRPGLVLAGGVGLLVLGYVVSVLFPLSDPLEPWRHASPWDWALGGDPLRAATPVWRYAVLLAGAAGLAAGGLLAFGRRDLRAA